MVLSLFSLVGDPIYDTIGWRVLATLSAGCIVVAAAIAWPNLSGGSVHRDLASHAHALAEYSTAVLQHAPPDEIASARERVLRTRMTAETSALAAAMEPVGHRLNPSLGTAVSTHLQLTTAHVIALGGFLRDRRSALRRITK